jgi:fatty-acyl-CoA synthase
VATVAQFIRRNAESTRPALFFEDRRWSHAEVVREAAARAALLLAERRPGPFHFGVLLENVPEAIFWLEAAAISAATAVGINSTRRGAELARDIAHTDCQFLITDAEGLELVRGLELGIPVWDIESEAYRAWLAPYLGAPLPDVAVGEKDCFVLIFTSGTTSAPKAALCSQGRIAAIAERSARMLGLGEQDVAYNAMPWFHSNALYVSILPSIAAGGALALRRRFSASRWLDDVRRYGVTYFNYVGKPLEYILATPPTPYDRDNQLRFGMGNEANEADIEAFSKRFKVRIQDGFGSTEMGVLISRVPGMPAGSLGRAPDENTLVMNPETQEECPRARFDASGQLLNPDEAIGELVNKAGLASFEGYYRNDEANAERARGGWYWSGDLGYRDAEGFFYFAGRGYDWLRVDGENFSAAPVERVLLRDPGVLLVAVYAVPDPKVGDQVMAALELKPGASFDPAAFGEFLASQPDLGTKQAPRFVRVVESLPLGHTNKILKRQLRAEGWQVSDPVWWRPGKSGPYRRLEAADAAALRAEFESAGRAHLLRAG